MHWTRYAFPVSYLFRSCNALWNNGLIFEHPAASCTTSPELCTLHIKTKDHPRYQGSALQVRIGYWDQRSLTEMWYRPVAPWSSAWSTSHTSDSMMVYVLASPPCSGWRCATSVGKVKCPVYRYFLKCQGVQWNARLNGSNHVTHRLRLIFF